MKKGGIKVLFCFHKKRSREQMIQDSLKRTPFQQEWLPLSFFERPGGFIKTTKLIKSYLKIENLSFHSFFGGFFFLFNGKPWGFNEDQGGLPITADYLCYAELWLQGVIDTKDRDHCHQFTIQGRSFELERRGEYGIIRDLGVENWPHTYGEMVFDYNHFYHQITGEMGRYTPIYKDLMKRLQYVKQDPARRGQAAIIEQFIPDFRDELVQLGIL